MMEGSITSGSQASLKTPDLSQLGSVAFASPPSTDQATHQPCEGLPSTFSQLSLPHPQTGASVAQSAAKLCLGLSLGSSDMLPICFGRKASIHARPWGGRSCLCQLPAMFRLSHPALAGGVPHDPVTGCLPPDSCTGTLWRHEQQNPSFLGPRDMP